jgi:hypothetical protein
MGLRFYPEANQTHYLQVLSEASEASEEKFSVYTHETMPERYHFSYNERIAPVYVVPKLGYALTDRKEGDVGMSKGVSESGSCSSGVAYSSRCLRSESWL